MRTNRRSFLALTGAAGGAAALAACGGSDESTSTSGEASDAGAAGTLEGRGPITFARGKDTTGTMQAILDQWNAEHPDEEVSFAELSESSDASRDLLINNFQAKSDAYDVMGLDVVWTAEFAANQWIVELPETDFDFSGFIPATLDTVKYFDRLYAVPFMTNAELLFSRTDLLEEVGATEAPKTFDEMWTLIDQIKQNHPEIAGYGSQFSKYEGLTCNFVAAVASAGGAVFDAEGKPTVDTPEALRALETLRQGFDEEKIPQEALTYKEEESRQAFQDGRLAFLTNWPYVYALGQAEDGSSKVNGKITVSVNPGLSGEGKSALGGDNYAISAFSKNKATAKDFIAFMTAEAGQKAFALASGSAPSREGLYEDAEILEAYPFFPTLLDGIKNGVARPQAVNYSEVTQAIQDAIYGCISGETEPQETLTALQETLSGLVEG